MPVLVCVITWWWLWQAVWKWSRLLCFTWPVSAPSLVWLFCNIQTSG